MPTITPPKPGFENIMLRVTPKLKEKVAETAKDEQVSQNTLMTASLFLSTLAWGKMPIVGPPDNILAFLAETERAAESSDLAYGAFNIADWDQIYPFVQLFSDYGFVSDLQFRTDQAARETVAYRLYLTKLGSDVLPRVAWIVRAILEGKSVGPLEEAGA